MIIFLQLCEVRRNLNLLVQAAGHREIYTQVFRATRFDRQAAR